MKRRKVRIFASALALALTVSMSGCTVSINMENKNKKKTETTETAETKEKTTKEDKTEKETKKAKEETEKADPTATPTPVTSQQTTPQNQYVIYYVVNCKQSITLRPQPDVNSGEITQIPLGSAVSYVEAAENGFYKVIYNGSTGYALASYLSATKPSETATSGQINTADYETYYVVNCKQSITLRPQPDVNSGEITQIPLGAAVSYVKAAENGFYQVIYNGNTGYALASYLSATKPSVSTSNNTVSYETYYVVNCKQSITLRPQPDVNSGEICQIPLGAAVSFISTASNGFYYISYNGNTGYSLASYLSSSSGNSSYSTCRVVNCNESITLRPQPDVDSGEICQIPLGETVSYIGTAENGFYEIYYMGNHGYSLADYLEFE